MENSSLIILYLTAVLSTVNPLIVTDSLLSPDKNVIYGHLSNVRNELMSVQLQNLQLVRPELNLTDSCT